MLENSVSSHREPILLARDCTVILIPAGTPIVLEKGTKVFVTQSLGGSHTVQTEQGFLARIDGKDADAIGLEAEATEVEGSGEPQTAEDVEKEVWERLKTVYDPEIPANVVDLGLIYECKVSPLGDTGGHKVDVEMTLTAPGCGMGDVLRNDAQTKIESIESVTVAEVKLVIEPPWTPDRMSEAARLQLGMM